MAAKSASPAALQILEGIGVIDLPEDWDIVRLESLLSDDRGIAVGVMYPGDHDAAGVPLIRAGDLAGSRINPRPEFRIATDKHHEYRRTELTGGELLISLVGDVGRCALVPPLMAGWNAARAIAVLRFSNPSDAAFVRACLMSSPLQHLMQSWSTTTVQATLNLKEIRQIPLPWPPRKERDAIAYILDTLNAKMELDRQMNETLEAMARTLFKSWFVDFDPVRAKAEGRNPGLPKSLADLFPDSFEDSELGEIPRGWEVKAVEEIATRVGMGPFGSSIKVESFVPKGVPVISGQHLRGFMVEDTTFNFVTEEHAKRLKAANVQRGDVVFTHAGNIGQVAYIPENSRYGRYMISQRQFFMRCDPVQVTPSFLAFYFRSPEGRHQLLANASSSGVPSIARPVTYLRSIRLTIPSRPIMDAFEKLVRPLLTQFRRKLDEGGTLATIRDTLLPKLISGAVRVSTNRAVQIS